MLALAARASASAVAELGAPLPERPERHHDLVARAPPCVSLEDFGAELQEQEAKLAEQLRSQQRA